MDGYKNPLEEDYLNYWDTNVYGESCVSVHGTLRGLHVLAPLTTAYYTLEHNG